MALGGPAPEPGAGAPAGPPGAGPPPWPPAYPYAWPPMAWGPQPVVRQHGWALPPAPVVGPGTVPRRLGAALIDLGVLVAGLVVASLVMGVAVSAARGVVHDVVVACFAEAIILAIPGYFVLGWHRGATPGMSALSLRISSEGGGPLPVGRAVLRLFARFWSVVLLFGGYVAAASDPRRRAWHDRMAGAVVTRVAQPWMGWVPPPPPPPGAQQAVIAAPEPAGRERRLGPLRWLAATARTPWSFIEVALVVGLFFPMASLADSLLAQPLLNLFAGTDRQTRVAAVNLTLDAIAYGMSLLLMYLLVHVVRRTPFDRLGYNAPERWGWIAAAVPFTAFVLVAEGPLAYLNQALFPGVNPQCGEIRHAFGGLVLLAIVAVCVIPPIAEETIFRGLVFQWLRGRLPLAAAVLISGIGFAAMHRNLQIVLPITGTGVWLALLYNWSRSLYPGMVVHGLNNLLALINILYGPTCS